MFPKKEHQQTQLNLKIHKIIVEDFLHLPLNCTSQVNNFLKFSNDMEGLNHTVNKF